MSTPTLAAPATPTQAALLARRQALIREINDLTRAFQAGYQAYIDPAIRSGERFLLSIRMDATQDAIKAKLVELGEIREALSVQADEPEAVVA